MRPRVPSGVSFVADVVETRLGKTCCTCWAMKPSWVVEPSEGSSQVKETGLRDLMRERVLVEARG